MKKIFALFLCVGLFFSCGQKSPEMTLEEIAEYKKNSGSLLLEKTLYKPWKGGGFADGTEGGEWFSSINADPKTFNQYIAERDAESAGIINQTLDSLVDYDNAEKKWFPKAAFFEVETNKKKKHANRPLHFA